MTYQLPDGFTTRPATPNDAGSVAALRNARSEVLRGEQPSTSERVRRAWDHPKFDLATDSRLVFAPHDVGHVQSSGVRMTTHRTIDQSAN